MKDNFSTHSAEYARFRPGYPQPLFDFLFLLCQHFDLAWDAATGNGQIAVGLAPRFRQVLATDISENQLVNAQVRPNIHYAVGSAEMTMTYSWNLEQLLGYLSTWSAIKRFTAQYGHSPLNADFVAAMRLFWADNEVKMVHFPIFARIARV